MKIGIVGTGLVGATAAYACIMRGVGREIVLVDLNKQRAEAEADDLLHAVPFASPLRVTTGDYGALRGAAVVIIAAGVGQRPGETRLQLLSRNAAIFRDVIDHVLSVAPGAVLIVATNPVDIMTHLAARYAADHGVPSSRVLGSGTTLDTARFRALLGQHLGIDAQHVHGYVLGEHGDSEVLAWSSVNVASFSLSAYCTLNGIRLDDALRADIDRRVRTAAYAIIEGKGATYYGIGSALARIVDVILTDQRAMLSVCTPLPSLFGVDDVTVSVPHLLGGGGILTTMMPALTADEEAQLAASAQLIRDAITALDQAPAS